MESKRAGEEAFALEGLLARARAGDTCALERLVKAIKDPVYGLALRMLAEPTEAEDATQEILVKVVTRLDRFRGESRFTTWVHAVAANHLRTLLAGRQERRPLSLEQVIELEPRRLSEANPHDVERTVLMRELRPMCLLGVLVRLDRDHRLAYVLGEVLELSGVEGAQVLGIGPDTFRKRLSRARRRIRAYMAEHDGPVRPGRRRRERLSERDPVAVQARQQDLEELRRLRALFRASSRCCASDHLVDDLTRMLAVA